MASQLIGLVMTRYLLALEPLASMPAERAWSPGSRPTLQRYLDGPLLTLPTMPEPTRSSLVVATRTRSDDSAGADLTRRSRAAQFNT